MYKPFATLFIEFDKGRAWVFTPVNWWKVQSTVQSSDVFWVFCFLFFFFRVRLKTYHYLSILLFFRHSWRHRILHCLPAVWRYCWGVVTTYRKFRNKWSCKWMICFIIWVYSANWPPYRVLKTVVSSVSPSSEPSCKYFVSSNRLTRFLRRAPENKCCFRVDLSVAVLLVWDIRPLNYHMTRSALRAQSCRKLHWSRRV